MKVLSDIVVMFDTIWPTVWLILKWLFWAVLFAVLFVDMGRVTEADLD